MYTYKFLPVSIHRHKHKHPTRSAGVMAMGTTLALIGFDAYSACPCFPESSAKQMINKKTGVSRRPTQGCSTHFN